MIAVGKPGAVVAGENDKCVFVEAVGLERVENAADAAINLGDDIGMKALAGGSVALFGDK